MSALSGSREPSPSSTGLGPSGFDPERMRVLGSRVSFLTTMVDTEIKRCGEFESFLIRAGLLREILEVAASAIEAAAAGETPQIGSTEGESAVPKADAQTPPSNPNEDGL